MIPNSSSSSSSSSVLSSGFFTFSSGPLIPSPPPTPATLHHWSGESAPLTGRSLQHDLSLLQWPGVIGGSSLMPGIPSDSRLLDLPIPSFSFEGSFHIGNSSSSSSSSMQTTALPDSGVFSPGPFAGESEAPPPMQSLSAAWRASPTGTPDLTRSPKRVRLSGPDAGEFHLTNPFSAPLSVAPSDVLRIAAHIIRSRYALKSGQPLRDEEIDTTLNDIFPREVLHTISGYALESCLMPLDLQRGGGIANNDKNREIMQCVMRYFETSDSDSRQLQKNITDYHGNTRLEPYFKGLLEYSDKCDTQIQAIQSGDQAALKNRLNKISMAINYLRRSKCEAVIREEMTQISHEQTRRGSGKENQEQVQQSMIRRTRRLLNLKLIIRALEEVRPGHDQPDIDQAHIQLQLNKLQTTHHIQAGEFDQAQNLLLTSMNTHCQIRQKREVIQIARHLIQLARRNHSASFQEMIQFFNAVKPLCLTYPADNDLFAKLLFTLDDIGQERHQFAAVKNLFGTCQSTLQQLSYGHLAKVHIRSLQLNRNLNTPSNLLMDDIVNTIKNCHRALGGVVFNPVPKEGSPFREMNTDEFYDYFSALFQMLANCASDELARIDTMSQAQRAQFCSLLNQKIDVGKIGPVVGMFTFRRKSDAPLLAGQPTQHLRRQIMTIVADYYRNALKLQRTHIAQRTKKSRVIQILDQLVNLYVKYREVAELEALLDKKNFTGWQSYLDTPTELHRWQLALTALKQENH